MADEKESNSAAMEPFEEEKKVVTKPSKAKSNLSTAITTFSHAFLLGITLFIIILSSSGSTLFYWHPPLMTTGFMFCMAEAVMCLSPNNFVTCWFTRKTRVKIHLGLQLTGATLIIAGFVIILVVKGDNPHFTSNHGKVGLTAVICCAFMILHGFLTYFSQNLKTTVKPIIIKLVHVELGLVTYILGVTAVLLGLFSHWFIEHGSYNTRNIFIVVVILGALMSLESALRSAYSKWKIVLSR